MSTGAIGAAPALEPIAGVVRRVSLVRLGIHCVPLAAVAVAALLFGVFVSLAGADPVVVYAQMYRGAFGTWFSFQNTLLRASPLILTALCTALPARLGLVIIGGEGALVIGGLAAAAAALALPQGAPLELRLVMAVAAALAGGLWIGAAGALRALRGVNETISSLLLSYVAIALLNHAVEGPLKDPSSLNKPATPHIGEANMIPALPGLDVHYGLLVGVVCVLLAWLLMERSVFGFSAGVVGGNARAAHLMGLPVSRLVLLSCFLGGAAAGLAGMLEVAAVHGRANSSLVAGYGYAGILVSFLARHHPLGILPVAILMGGIAASGGLVQRVTGLPDAAVNVLQGLLFICILASEFVRGRLEEWRVAREAA
jgi:simple sugar transport system permease protein